MSQDPQSVYNLFVAALELGETEGRAFLDMRCLGNPELRAEVERHLVAYERECAEGVLASGLINISIAEHDPLVGQRIGPYELKRRVGRGGMGEVYLAARINDYRQRVAVKLVKRGMDTEEILRRFREERQLMAGLKHPNIARLLDGGTTQDGRPYFVMEFIEGMPIDEFCNRRRLSIMERLQLFAVVCEAVHFCHGRLVVHRDLKPSNTLVTADGIPKLLDFGVAKIIVPETSCRTRPPTQTAFRVMSKEYASPEQVRGDPITTSSDIYSLGVLLYELLTGHHPYWSETYSRANIEKLVCEKDPEKPSVVIGQQVQVEQADGTKKLVTPQNVANTRGDDIARLCRQLKGDIDNIVLKAMRKEPQRRYDSATQLSEDIQRHLDGHPVLARPPSTRYRAGKLVGRHKWAIAGLGVLVLLLMTLGITMSFQASRYQGLAEDYEEVAENERAAQAQSAAALMSLKEKSLALEESDYRNRIALAAVSFEQGNTRRMKQLLGNCPSRLRAWEWYYLSNMSDCSRFTIAGDEPVGAEKEVHSVEFSPEGNCTLIVRDSRATLCDSTSGHTLLVLDPEGTQGHCMLDATFSPDGSCIASAGKDKTIRLWNARDGKLLKILLGGQRSFLGVCFSQDGRRLAATNGHEIWIWDTSSYEVVLSFRWEPLLSSIVFTPDSTLIAGVSSSCASGWDSCTGEWLRRDHVMPQSEEDEDRARVGAYTCLAFSPNDQWLAIGDANGALLLLDAKTWDYRARLCGHSSIVTDIAFSPNGTQLASASQDQTIRIWSSSLGRELFTLRGHTAGVTSVCYSPDGQQIASGSSDGTAKLWNVAKASLPRTYELNSARGPLAFTPDGRHIACTVYDDGNATALLDPVTLQTDCVFTGHVASITSLAFTSDGEHLISTSEDRTLRIWPMSSTMAAKEIHDDFLFQIQAHEYRVNSVAFNLATTAIASGAADGTAKILAMPFGEEVLTITGNNASVNCVAWRPEGNRIALACADGRIEVWGMASGKKELELQCSDGPLNVVLFDCEGEKIVTGGADGILRLWNSEDGRLVRAFQGHQAPIWGAYCVPKTTLVMSCSGELSQGTWTDRPKTEDTLRLWDISTGQEVIPKKKLQNQLWNYCLDANEDGSRIVTGHVGGYTMWSLDLIGRQLSFAGSMDYYRHPTINTIAVGSYGEMLVLPLDSQSNQEGCLSIEWPKTQRKPVVLGKGAVPVTSVALSANGRYVACGKSDGTVTSWNAPARDETRVLRDFSEPVVAAAISEDSRLVVSIEYSATDASKSNRPGSVCGWDVSSGRRLFCMNTHGAHLTYACLSPNGRFLACVTAEGDTQLWDIGRKAVVWSASGAPEPPQEMLLFSASGELLASSSTRCHQILLRNAGSGEAIRILDGHRGGVRAMALSPDGRRLASAGDDRTIRIWDHIMGEELLVLRGHEAPITSLVFDPLRSNIVSIDATGAIRVWESPQPVPEE